MTLMRQLGAILPLDGVRVVDLTRVLAGPLCTMMLADMGAQVIKVEKPGSGDESRGWGPPFHENGQSGYFLSLNRNKKGIALDLGRQADHEVLIHLLSGAHVVVDNFRVGNLERFGIDPLECLRRQPQLIWCSITGFGAESPRPGYDYLAQAEQGWMSITGEAEGPPLKTGIALADIVAGKDAAIAILATLSAVSRNTQIGNMERRISISLARSATSALLNVAQNVLITGKDATRHGNGHPNLVPYQLFETADRPIVLAVGNDSQWSAAVLALGGLEDLATDNSLATNAGRVRARAHVTARLAERFREEQCEHWLRVLSDAGVPAGEVRSVREALDAAEEKASSLTGLPPAVPGSIRFPAPQLDEHGPEIRARGWKCFDTPE